MTRTNASGSGQLVKYIFRYIFKGQSKGTKKDYDRPLYIPKGVATSEKDIRFLYSEKIDAELLADFKEKYPDGNYKSYIENHLLPIQSDARNDNTDVNTLFVIKHNVRGNSINEFINEFGEAEKGRVHTRSHQTVIHHTVISWSNKDSALITDEILKDMAKQYINLRGIQNLYVATKHTDRQHTHLHFGMSATNLAGRSSRISKLAFEGVKIKLQEYQRLQYPQLSHSLPDHGRSRREKGKGDIFKFKNPERTSVKALVQSCIETNYLKSTSTEHFISLLNKEGYWAYSRNSKLAGIETKEGYKFRFTSLGIDLNYLKELDELLAKEEDAVKELRKSRESKDRSRMIPEVIANHQKEVAPQMSEQDQIHLQQIQDARKERSHDLQRDADSDNDTQREQATDDRDDTSQNDIERKSYAPDTDEEDLESDDSTLEEPDDI